MSTKFSSQFERMKQLLAKHESIFQIVVLIIISGAIYLPRLSQFQYYKDEWYFVLDGLYGGATVFKEMFSIDRPARGLFFQVAFTLFGGNPLPYHLGQYFWHVSAAITALYLFRMVWPNRNRQAFFVALFFLIYPGYVWWPAAIEYQPQMASLFLEVLSIVLTVKAIFSTKLLHKIMWMIGSIVSGWSYLALVEYAIGMEFFRLVLIFVLLNRKADFPTLRKKIHTIAAWLNVAILIPAGFLFWRLFLFSNTRKATDLGAQLATLTDMPVHNLKLWLVGLARDSITVSVLAWIEPFSQFFWSLNLDEIIIGLFIAFLFVVFIFVASHFMSASSTEKVLYEPVIVGFISCVVGVVPVVIANRYIDFGPYSHYSLPVSLASALFFASLIPFISPRGMQYAFASLVVAAAALTHFSIATSIAREIEIINTFWWQTYWRAPEIRSGTTLIVDYPILGFDDQTDNIWGPANLLYYPQEKQTEIPVQYHLAALSLVGPELENVLSKGEQKAGYRTHYFRYNVAEILVLTQPNAGSCVRILDGNIPVFSSGETTQIKNVASYSKLDSITLDSPSPLPLPIFGKEPDHDWCYYFEKIELAIQQRDWSTSLALADQALALGLSPSDPVEWMPFLYAYMISDNLDMVTNIARQIKGDEFLEQQTCNVISEFDELNTQLSQEMSAAVNSLFCFK